MNNVRDLRLRRGKSYGVWFDGRLTSGVNLATVNNNSLLQTINAFSFECFIKLTIPTHTQFARILEYSGTNKGIKIQLTSPSSSIVAASVGNGAQTATVISTFGLRNDDFRHLEVSWDGHYVRMFLNGVQTGGDQALAGGDWGDPGRGFTIGGSTPFSAGIGAVIQEVRLSNIARHTTEFAPPTERYVTDENTIGLWHFSDKNKTIQSDYSGNGLNAVLSGSPLPRTDYYPGYF